MVSRAAWLYIGLVVLVTAVLVARTPMMPPDGTVHPLIALIVLQLLFLACDSSPAPLASRQTKWSPSSSATLAAAVLLDPRGRTLLIRRPESDGALFSRLWQFPSIEVARDPLVELDRYLRETLKLDSAPLELEALPAARHGVTFRNITLLPFLARVAELPRLPHTRVLAFDRIVQLPISSATRKIAAAARI